MRELSPTDTDQRAAELWRRVNQHAETAREDDDEPEDPSRRRAVLDLCERLEDHPCVEPLVAAIKAEGEEGEWDLSAFNKRRLGFHGDLAHLVIWLIGVKSTSGEATNKYFHAIQAAACDRAGVDRRELSDEAAKTDVEHGELLRLWIDSQYELSAELLDGLDETPLHRGARITVAPTDDATGPVNPTLWPVASFATNFDVGVHFAGRAFELRPGGFRIVYSSIVPVERILATPATGAANWGEDEVVILAGNPADLSRITAL